MSTRGYRSFPDRSRPCPLNIVPDIFKRPHALSAGTAILHDALVNRLGTKTLGQVYAERGIALRSGGGEMTQHRSWVFKTPHLEKTNHRDGQLYSRRHMSCHYCRSCVTRSLAAIDHPDNTASGFNVFVDGGLWANNPVLVGLIDALDLDSARTGNSYFSLGTCPLPAGEQIPKTSLNRGLNGWNFGGGAAGLSE